MPEGPEIFIIAKALNRECKKKKIVDIKIHTDSRYKIDDRYDLCIGKKILGVQHKGKKIIFVLEGETYLVSFLGLEGNWSIEQKIPDNTRHLSVSILMDKEYLLYRDQRHFGELVLCKNAKELGLKMESVGPSWIPSEMYPEEIDLEYFTKIIRSNTRIRNKQIMLFLVEQKYASGVGNYIRAEALYISRINPRTPIGYLTDLQISLLFEAINKVMAAAVKSGGHTLRSYTSLEGNKGGYVPLVYGRSKSFDTNQVVVRETDAQKRSIYWVPTVQV